MSSRDLSQLKEPFQQSIRLLLDQAKKAGLPVLVTETTRTLAEQKANVAKGVSWTLKSLHLTGEAIDIAFQVNGKLSYDPSLYDRLYAITKNIPYVIWPFKDLNWGIDKPHHQYLASKKSGIISPMPTDEERVAQIKRLQEEVRRLTSEVMAEKTQTENYQHLLHEEQLSHAETLDKANSCSYEREGLRAQARASQNILHKLKQVLDEALATYE